MKNNITISIDSEIVRKLKEESNYSDVINEQMKGYYAVKTCENVEILRLNLAKTKQILKENRKKRREIEAVLSKIDKKQKLFKKRLLSRGKMIKQIIQNRANSQTPHSRVKYFTTPEEEADRLIERGWKK